MHVGGRKVEVEAEVKVEKKQQPLCARRDL